METNRRVEFDNGFVEVHDVPTDQHQAIILCLSIVLNRFALQIGGVVRTAGLRLRLWDRKYREPDIVLLRNRDSKLRQENFWDGADLAVEVVSQSHEDRERNLVTKRTEYERVGIQEYWIVDPEQKTVTVLSLSGEVYSEGDLFGRGDIVRSPLFRELALPVAEILDAN
ncbi:MAG: Uma2 family endonuclease [Caldilineaceae bacterium]|nr:Uma2 family endonuclease [Caldilineaceae bacterium]